MSGIKADFNKMSGLQMLHRYVEIDREVCRLEDERKELRDELARLVESARAAQKDSSSAREPIVKVLSEDGAANSGSW